MIALYSGVSGMSAQQQALDVIANNVANVNTVGYKASQINFVDALSNTLFGGSANGQNPMQVGLGVAVGSISREHEAGEPAGHRRFRRLRAGGKRLLPPRHRHAELLTRNGNFGLDANNRLVSTDTGLPVLGWQADPITGAGRQLRGRRARFRHHHPVGHHGPRPGHPERDVPVQPRLQPPP